MSSELSSNATTIRTAASAGELCIRSGPCNVTSRIRDSALPYQPVAFNLGLVSISIPLGVGFLLQPLLILTQVSLASSVYLLLKGVTVRNSFAK